MRDSVPLTDLVNGIAAKHGEKRHLTLMDNNITATPRYKEIIAEIIDLGFGAGAKLQRKGSLLQRRLDFNQGVDARILCKDPMYLREMAKTCINPLRIAFDHLGLKKSYMQAVRYANEYGIHNLSNYMLYNFLDKPADLYERLHINIVLNRELNLRIWSFPMRFQPVTLKDRSHVGKHWSWYQLRSFQVILQATHGVVTGNPKFFYHAFGEDAEEFNRLLFLPHHMIFYREYYETGEGKAEREECEKRLKNLSEGQTADLHEILSKLRSVRKIQPHQHSADSTVQQLLAFYKPMPKEQQDNILQSRKVRSISSAVDVAHSPALEEDQRVEDAGLYDNDKDNEKHAHLPYQNKATSLETPRDKILAAQ